MLIDHEGFQPERSRPDNAAPPTCWAELPGDEGLLLWSLRRTIVAWPRCHTVHAALHSRYGESALGVEHLLRCWLVGLSNHARRQLVVGDPNCTLLLADEGVLLFILRPTTAADAAAAAVIELTGNPCAACLLPLAAALAEAARL